MRKEPEGNECKRVQDAASYLGISVPQAYRLARSGIIPSIRLLNRVIIPWAKFLAWVDEQSGGTAV